MELCQDKRGIYHDLQYSDHKPEIRVGAIGTDHSERLVCYGALQGADTLSDSWHFGDYGQVVGGQICSVGHIFVRKHIENRINDKVESTKKSNTYD